MGLDTYAAHTPDDIELTEEDIQAFMNADISLCGGIFSGDGCDGSFRGKVYAEAVLEITEESLYQEWIPPETVHKMYQSLKAFNLDQGIFSGRYDILPADILELRKFFKVCSERGLGLVAWS
jgi:hypothetical protein